jgi:hypothetical protein
MAEKQKMKVVVFWVVALCSLVEARLLAAVRTSNVN